MLSLDHDPATWSDSGWSGETIAFLGAEATCLAYDTIQGYFGVGTKSGKVLLLGASGLEKRMDPPPTALPQSCIQQLLFKSGNGAVVHAVGDSILVGANQVGQVLVWNLANINHITSLSISFPDPILRVDLLQSSQWLVIAFTTGLVKLMDCASTRMSPYVIPLDLNPGHRLVTVQACPSTFNMALLGFENECITWDFDQKRPIDRFATDAHGAVTACCWGPSGTFIAVGYADGTISIWTRVKKRIVKTKNPVHSLQISSAVSRLEWTSVNGSQDSELYASHATQPKVSLFPFQGEKFEKAQKAEYDCVDVVDSFLVLKANYSVILLTLSVHDRLQIHYHGPNQAELPASLFHYSLGPHRLSAISDDGFLYINAVKKTKEKKPTLVFGGTLLPKNAIRNYHVMAVLRGHCVEFWHMAIPFPYFLTSIAVQNPSVFDKATTLCLDLKSRMLRIVTTTKLVLCEFMAQHDDVDDIFSKIDETMDALDRDMEVIKRMQTSTPPRKNTDQASPPAPDGADQENASPEPDEIDLTSIGPNGKAPEPDQEIARVGTPSSIPSVSEAEPPLLMPRSSSLQSLPPPDAFRISYAPEMYIADAQWTTFCEIELGSPIVSHAHHPTHKSIALATATKVVLFDEVRGRQLFDATLAAYLVSRADLLKNASFSYITYTNIHGDLGLLVCATQSLFLFTIQDRVVTPSFAFHAAAALGTVVGVDGLDADRMLCNESQETSYLVVFAQKSVLLFDCNEHGSITQVARRDFSEEWGENKVVKASCSVMQETTYGVLVTLESIIVLSLPSLAIAFKLSFQEIPVSTTHLPESYISKAGMVGLWLHGNRWCMLRIHGSEPIPQYDMRLYDHHREKRYHDEAGTSNLSKGKRNEKADELFAPKPAVDSAPGVAGDLARIGQQLQERGEKLDRIEEKTASLADASSLFAANVRKITEQQKKSWW
ncbi:hypothetical protein HDV03_001825 [Kappamyces sp. JEL0829]|nr:hypothetical protein HDV03_001825 [Kappamyces sp. JEL0829]